MNETPRKKPHLKREREPPQVATGSESTLRFVPRQARHHQRQQGDSGIPTEPWRDDAFAAQGPLLLSATRKNLPLYRSLTRGVMKKRDQTCESESLHEETERDHPQVRT